MGVYVHLVYKRTKQDSPIAGTGCCLCTPDTKRGALCVLLRSVVWHCGERSGSVTTLVVLCSLIRNCWLPHTLSQCSERAASSSQTRWLSVELSVVRVSA